MFQFNHMMRCIICFCCLGFYKLCYTGSMRSKSSGNVLFIILIAVALFAALTAVVSQLSDQNQKGLSGEKASLIVDQIFNFAESVKTGTNFILAHNDVLETQIRFAHPDLNAAYGNSGAIPVERLVFHPSGGGVTYQDPPANANDGTPWFFTSAACVPDVGTGAGGSCTSAAAQELLLILPNVTYEVCVEIDKRLNLIEADGSLPKDDGNMYNIATDHFAGTFAAGYSIYDATGTLNGAKSGCVEGDSTPAAGTYHFYTVLLER